MVYADGAQRGPYSVSQLENFLRNGELPANSMVWTEGMADWKPIDSVLLPPAPQMSSAPVATQMKPVVAFTDPSAIKETDYTFMVVAHILMGVAILTGGFTAVIALIMAYVKREDVRGTYLESHCKWLIETFWWSLGISILGAMLLGVLIGVPILFGLMLWCIYRVVMGGIRISERRAL